MTAPDPAAPPPVPDASAPPVKKGMSVGMIILIICGVLAIPCIAGAIATVVVVVPQMQERQKRLTCQQNLSQLAQMFAMQQMEGGPPPASGPALFLGWRKSGRMIQAGKEEVLLCPGDTGAQPLVTENDRRVYGDVDLADPPQNLCSYVVRDFGRHPLPENSRQDEPIAACLHHAQGANIAFDNGSVRFVTYAELGYEGRDDVRVGPGSDSDVLKQLCYRLGETSTADRAPVSK